VSSSQGAGHLHAVEEVIMEKAARPLTTEPAHDHIVVRPKPDRRAQPRVPVVDIARQAFLPHDTLLTRIRAEYQEVPGLRLTSAQVQRLCGVEQALCRMALKVLVDEKFLCVKSDGHYARPTDEMIPRPQPSEGRPQDR
jgi:hypothetical protein